MNTSAAESPLLWFAWDPQTAKFAIVSTDSWSSHFVQWLVLTLLSMVKCFQALASWVLMFW